jgi:hypothetical protein
LIDLWISIGNELDLWNVIETFVDLEILTETFAAVKTLKANSSDCWNLLLTFK